MAFKAAKCPSCGGDLQLPDNVAKVNCMYCGVDILVEQAIKDGNVEVLKNLNKLVIAAIMGRNHQEAYNLCLKMLELGSEDESIWFFKGLSAIGLSSKENPRFDEALLCLKKSYSMGIDESLLEQRATYLHNFVHEYVQKLAEEVNTISRVIKQHTEDGFLIGSQGLKLKMDFQTALRYLCLACRKLIDIMEFGQGLNPANKDHIKLIINLSDIGRNSSANCSYGAEDEFRNIRNRWEQKLQPSGTPNATPQGVSAGAPSLSKAEKEVANFLKKQPPNVPPPAQIPTQRSLYPPQKAPQSTIMGLPTLLWVIVGGVVLIIFFLFVAFGLFLFMGTRGSGSNSIAEVEKPENNITDASQQVPLEKAIIGQWVLQKCEYKTSSGETGQNNSLHKLIEFNQGGRFRIIDNPIKNQSGFWNCGTWSMDGEKIVLGPTIAPCDCNEVKQAFFMDTLSKTGDRNMAQEIASGMCEPADIATYLWGTYDFSVSGNILTIVAEPGSMLKQASDWEELTMSYKRKEEQPKPSTTETTDSTSSTQQPATTSEDLGTMLAKGEGFFKAKQYTQAKVCFQKAYEMNPSPNDTMLKYAFCCGATKDYQTAQQLLDLFLSSNPTNEMALVMKAGVYVEQKDVDNAVIAVSRLEKSYPQNRELASLKNRINQLRPGAYRSETTETRTGNTTLDISINPGGTKKGTAYVFIDGQQVQDIPIKKGLLEKFIWNGSFQLTPGFHTIKVQLETELMGVKTVKEQQYEFKAGQKVRLSVKLDKVSKELLFNWD